MAWLLLTALAAAATTGAQAPPGLVLYVAPNGSDTNSGGSPKDPLLSVTRAAAAVAAQLSRGLPAGGAEVRILPGRYQFNASGNTLRLGADFRASADRPVVFRGWGVTPTAPAVFDGSAQLDATQLKPITNATVAAIVNPAAAGKLLSMAVPAHLSAVVRAGTEYRPIVEGWSAESMAIGSGSLQWGDTLLTPSTWPNTGLGYVQRVNDKGAVWAVRSHGSSCFRLPSARAADCCPQAGRTKGPKPSSSMADPIGANFTIANGTSGQPTGDWNAELAAGFEGGSVSGYFAADWYGPLLRQTAPFSTVAQCGLVDLFLMDRYKESHRIARVSEAKDPTTVMLLDSSRCKCSHSLCVFY